MELFLRLEYYYNSDIKGVLENADNNPFDPPKINLKSFEKCMRHMQKIVRKVESAANANFEKEIKNVSSSLLSSSIWKSNMGKSTIEGKNMEESSATGLPLGVTEAQMDAYIARWDSKSDLPLYVKYSTHNRILVKYGKSSNKYRSFLKKNNLKSFSYLTHEIIFLTIL